MPGPDRRTRATLTLTLGLGCACLPVSFDAIAQPSAAATLPPVEVVAPALLPGIGVPGDRLPYTVETLGRDAIRSENAVNLPEALGLRLPGVSVNEIQGNPFQPDLSYRGFAASPLLGTPQGLSVFLDGVRVNEAFGDVINWDLIPQAAIDQVSLVPGSNPLYGLNTLGAAIALRTKSGDTHPGAVLEGYGGSFRRYAAQFELGRRLPGNAHVFAAGTYFDEDGWRDYSPSQVGQFFAKIGRRTAASEIDLSYAGGATDLVGNGLVPQSFLAQSPTAIFTRPDQTRNWLNMATLSGTWFASDAARLTGLAYYRNVRTRTLNGDVNDGFEGGPDDAAAGGSGAIVGTAVNNRTLTQQSGAGGALQWSFTAGRGQYALGAAYDESRSDFGQSGALGVFDPTRAVAETDPELVENALTGRVRNAGLYATGTLPLVSDLFLTLSGRYNRARVTLQDTGPSAPALDGRHTFAKFNPAVGLAYQWRPALTYYAGYAQGSRAPSPIELGCADPARPCTLPNALAADPPLEQVVTRTFELGLRGRLAGAVRWSAGLFQATSADDILFVGTTTSAGYFTNFGRTRRRGAELAASGDYGGVQWSASYTFVRATFESTACIVSENNSTRGTSTACSPQDPANPGTVLGDDLIAVAPGDRLPGVPEQAFKLAASYGITGRWRVGAELVAFSSLPVRGNENNRHQPGTFTDLNGDTRTFLGPGNAGGYALLNLSTRFTLAPGLELFARIANVFDRKYATAGALAENPFNAAGKFQTDSDLWARETFFAPGAPRAGWIGLRYRFGSRGTRDPDAAARE